MTSILHTIPSLIPESGGPSRSVTGLCTALAQRGNTISLLSLDVGQSFSAPITPPPDLVSTTLVANRFSVGLRQLWAPHFKKMLSQMVSEQSIHLIHDHCIWLPTNIAVTQVAHKAGIPLIVSLRGMLEPWAWQHNRWKKRLMWHLYQKQNLRTTQILHATSKTEANNLRTLGLKQPIAVIPNGVTSPSIEMNSPLNAGRKKHTLFVLTRIHPVKGLLNLVEALKFISSEGWQVIIAGPNEGGHQAEVEAAVEAAGLQDVFTFYGPVDDQAKWDLYRQADLFILPTFSENFGIVVAEALACEVPVITTTGTPWRELIDHHCGWWVEPQPDALAQALREAMNLSDAQRNQMGQNGRHLIQQKYTWPAIAQQMTDLYHWILGGNTKPDFVLD